MTADKREPRIKRSHVGHRNLRTSGSVVVTSEPDVGDVLGLWS